MNTYADSNAGAAPALTADVVHDGVTLDGFAFAATPLPIIGKGAAAAAPAGIALAFATAAAEATGEDRFVLHVVDAEGEILSRLGPFTEEDIVATWRDCANRSGLKRMILREDGSIAPVSNQIGRLALGTSRQRRRHGLLNGRRPRFLVRRKTARLPARPQIHRGENEIIARS